MVPFVRQETITYQTTLDLEFYKDSINALSLVIYVGFT